MMEKKKFLYDLKPLINCLLNHEWGKHTVGSLCLDISPPSPHPSLRFYFVALAGLELTIKSYKKPAEAERRE